MMTEENVNYTSFVDRYFKRGFKANLPTGGTFEECCKSTNLNDIQILRHTNRICLVTLAPSHPIISQNKKIASVSFKVSEKLDRSNNKVSGKRKRGGQWLSESSVLCRITCHDDDVTYPIYCGVRGTLVEMNENLVTNPELMTSLTQPEHGVMESFSDESFNPFSTMTECKTKLISVIQGLTQLNLKYVAIVMPKIEEADRMMASLMDEKQFDEYKEKIETSQTTIRELKKVKPIE